VNPPEYAAIVLAGGAGRRMCDGTKPARRIGGRSMLDRVLAAVATAQPRIVVGPATLDVPAGVLVTCEQPPGGGPVAALAAGLAMLPEQAAPGEVALLAADLPFLTAADVDALLATLRARTGVPVPAGAEAAPADGAVYVDGSGRRQWLCGVWRIRALRRRLAGLGDPCGRRLGDLLAGPRILPVSVCTPGGPPPWYDCDTEDDLRRAEEWVGMDERVDRAAR
jgi:molybdopterin-guanine dinucleotide biosynthesis protein A